MRALAVTSPLSRGLAVHAAQARLAGRNRYTTDYLHGTVDSVFGQETGRGCRRAKYWLGYPTKDQTPVYGDTLDALLSGARRLPALYAFRRAARLDAAANPSTLGSRAVDALWPHRGLTESPAGSNRCLFSDWYGVTGPWCAMAATWAYVHAGSKAFQRGSRYAFVPFVVHDAHAGANGLAVTPDPKRGDLVCFDWDRDGTHDHVGLFLAWTDKSRGRFQTLEGNTSPDDHGSQSNGGGLFLRVRSLGAAGVVFVRVGR